jgi:predicted DNA-binding transcriptional regulator AlpA
MSTPVFGPAEFARQLGVSVPTVYKMRKAGRLPAPIYVTARRPKWTSADVQTVLDSQFTGTDPLSR